MIDQQSPTSGPAVIQWHQMKTTKGVPYEIGKIKSNRVAPGKAESSDTLVEFALSSMTVISTSKKDFGIVVNWEVGDKEWKDPGQDVKDAAGISRYSYHSSSHPFYDYVLEFTNTENYNYHFYDKTGDGYQVNCYEHGDHLVRLNSKNPAIKFITGS